MKYLLPILLLSTLACGGSSPVAPTVIVPECQTQNTAQLTLSNASATNATFDVLIDGVRRSTITPGQNAGPFTLAAGIAHPVESRLTNTTTVACSSSPILAQCSTQTLTCRF